MNESVPFDSNSKSIHEIFSLHIFKEFLLILNPNGTDP